VLSDTYQRLRASPFVVKITRYALGSVIALGTSVIVFAILYVLHVGTTLDSLLAFAAGAIPNWILNRRWAWERDGKVEIAREVIGYAAVSLLAVAASSATTGWINSDVANGIPAHTGLRVTIVTGGYVLVQAVLFVIKYVIYDRWVFAGRSRFRAAWRSRRQVWTAARANRTP
jgi:putative flippase GtrA